MVESARFRNRAGEQIIARFELNEKSEKVIDDLALLIGKLVEEGPGMPPATKAALRAAIAKILGAIGIDMDKPDWSEEYWGAWGRLMTDRNGKATTPEDFPSRGDFGKVMHEVKDKRMWAKDLKPRGGGQTLEDYEYGLATLMSSRLIYSQVFKSDPILQNRSGGVENGRHRALALKTLEELNYHPLQKWYWIRVEKE